MNEITPPDMSPELAQQFARAGSARIPNGLEATQARLQVVENVKLGDQVCDCIVATHMTEGGRAEVRSFVPLEAVRVLNFSNGEAPCCGESRVRARFDSTRIIDGALDVDPATTLLTEIRIPHNSLQPWSQVAFPDRDCPCPRGPDIDDLIVNVDGGKAEFGFGGIQGGGGFQGGGDFPGGAGGIQGGGNPRP